MKTETIKEAVKFGDKWQQERMYSEEDMAESFMACWNANAPEGLECKLSFKEWFNGFIAGDKHQQKISYSEEEVLEMMRITRRNEDFTVNQLFEQFKK